VISRRYLVLAAGSFVLGPCRSAAAEYVDRILKGAKPAEMPVEQPTTYELIVNLRSAKALGISVPPGLLVRATRIIE
jgi:putative tryptophan/tyrosine transport system substrate-binding protein